MFTWVAGTPFVGPGGAGWVAMFISLEVLHEHPLDFREEFPPEVIDFGPDLRQTTPLTSSGQASLIEELHGPKQRIEDIRLVGRFATQVQINCARCLEPVTRNLAQEFDLLYRPQGADAGKEEMSITDVEADIGYYQGEGLLLEDALREQVLLAVPLRTVCRDECKGLCPHCGKNLNQGPCNCAPPPADDRWDALRELKDKLEPRR